LADEQSIKMRQQSLCHRTLTDLCAHERRDRPNSCYRVCFRNNVRRNDTFVDRR